MSIKKVLSLFLIFILSFSALSFASGDYNVKVTEFSHLRDDVWGNISGYVKKNTVKTVYGVKKDSYGVDWYKVYYNGSYRYLNSLSTSKSFNNIPDFNVITTDLVHVRASAWGEILGFIRKNTVKTVYGIRRDRYGNTWYRIWYDGKAGYIKKDATSKSFNTLNEFVVKTTDLTALRDRPWGEKKGSIKKNTAKSVYGVRKDRFGYTWYRVYKNSKPYFISELSTSKKLSNIEDYNVITTDLVNVRDKVRGNVIGYVRKNKVKTVYGLSRDRFGDTWYRVWYNGRAGYIKKAATSKKLVGTIDLKVIVKASTYLKDDVRGENIVRLSKSKKKTVYGMRTDRDGNTWYRIIYNGKRAYVRPNNTIINDKLIAITYDDGPSRYTRGLLSRLKQENARATFFLLGSNISSKNRDILLRMKRDGHEIANHSYSHANMVKYSNWFIKNEFNKTDRIIKNITGETPKLVRYPYGSANSRVRNLIKKPEIYWRIDTRDWATRNRYRVKMSIINHARPGDIVLLHDTHRTSVDGSIDAIKILKKRGYKFVTVSDLMKYYNIKMKPSRKYGSLKNSVGTLK